MRRPIALLLVCVLSSVAACSGQGTPTPAPSTVLVAETATPTADPTPTSAPTVSPSPIPTPSPAPTPKTTPWDGEAAWLNGLVAVQSQAGPTGKIEAHLGNAFPVQLTGRSAAVASKPWYELRWSTAGRGDIGWVPASSIALAWPWVPACASIDALDSNLGAYLARIGSRVGVQVYDYTRNALYSFNSDKYYLVASSVKVPVMLTLLWQLETRKAAMTAYQQHLVTIMIENSDNDAVIELYREIGYQRGLNAFMKYAGVYGLNPMDPVTGPGWSTVTPAAMVSLLTKLHAGTILTAKDRAFALYLMQHIESDQRVGVGDTAPAGATVAMKDGWTPGPDGYWVMNTSGIVTVKSETYIVSVYTTHLSSLEEGWDIVRHTCQVIGQKLAG